MFTMAEAEDTPNPTNKPEPEVRYVLSGQPTGLAALSQAVREYDLERVQNAKEDIDTLLVFVRVTILSPYPMFDMSL